MPMLVQCPNPVCRASYSVAEPTSNSAFKCPKCAQSFIVEPTVEGHKGETKQSQPASSANPFPVLPAEFGRYRILKLLGRGGMGAVYLAQDSQLRRQVALKVPFFDAAEAPQRVERFVREAQSAAVLEHPNICTIFDAGQIDGRPFITMALLTGKPLEKEIDPDVPMSQVRAAEIVRKLALALEHAHSKGIVHRDLKPANVMLATGDEPIIMDFGLAKRVADVDPNEAKLTRLGGLLGTPSYMAPEQVKGDVSAIGPATDVYALGVLLFEMLTGRTPYSGSMSVIMGQILAAPVPPVQEFRPEVDSRLDAICRKAMAKNPGERFKSMADLANVLGFYLKAPSSPPPSPPVAPVFQAPAPVIDPVPFANMVAPSPSTTADQSRKEPARPVKHLATMTWLLAVGALGMTLFTLLLVVGLVGLWASGVFKLKTKDGVIVLENLPPDADVTVDGETVTVQSIDGKTFEIRVDASKKTHRVEVKKEGVIVFGEEVEVNAGGRKPVLVRLDPEGQPNSPDKSKKPATPGKPDGRKTGDVIANSIGMKFVWIEPGSFLMGSPDGKNPPGVPAEVGRAQDETAHRVTLTKGYLLGTNLVTQRQWEDVLGKEANQSSSKDTLNGVPVNNVSWFDCVEFCNKLSEKEGKNPCYRLTNTQRERNHIMSTDVELLRDGTGYRLPTEAEWEYAYRGGTQTAYFFGNDPKELSAYNWYGANAGTTSRPVGTLKPNPWGLYDMGGNLQSWCEDWYGPYGAEDITDPLVLDKGDKGARVLRSGCWWRLSDQNTCRAAFRTQGPPASTNSVYGCRVVRAAD